MPVMPRKTAASTLVISNQNWPMDDIDKLSKYL